MENSSELARLPFVDFPEEEERIIQFWRNCNAFLKSYEISVEAGRKPYVFYDGPPFATVLLLL
jgi:isoleucyl-tRNA synthetase